MTTTRDLDGLLLRALTSSKAHGCDGPADPDRDAHGRSAILLADATADAILDAALPTWNALWLFSPTLPGPAQDTARGIVESLGWQWPTPPPPPVPAWGPLWAGTLGEHATLVRRRAEGAASYDAGVRSLLAKARLEVFTRAGAVLTRREVPGAHDMVHDFGCSCSVTADTGDPGDQGRVQVRRHAAGLFFAPPGMAAAALDGAVARAVARGAEARERAAEGNANLLDPAVLIDLMTPAFPSAGEAGLTYAQWYSVRHARAVRDVQHLRDGNTHLARGGARRVKERRAEKVAYRSALWAADLRPIGAKEAARLARALAP